MKKLIKLYEDKSKLSKKVADEEDGLAGAIFSIKNELTEDLILALKTVNNELVDIKRQLEIKTQTFYYFACDKCGKMVLETDNPFPEDVCNHANEHDKGLCDGKFTKRLTREEYLDYFEDK